MSDTQFFILSTLTGNHPLDVSIRMIKCLMEHEAFAKIPKWFAAPFSQISLLRKEFQQEPSVIIGANQMLSLTGFSKDIAGKMLAEAKAHFALIPPDIDKINCALAESITPIVCFNLDPAVRDGKLMQDLELESLCNGVGHSQMVKDHPIANDSGSRDCVKLPSPTAGSRFKDLSSMKGIAEALDKEKLQKLYLLFDSGAINRGITKLGMADLEMAVKDDAYIPFQEALKDAFTPDMQEAVRAIYPISNAMGLYTSSFHPLIEKAAGYSFGALTMPFDK